MSLIKTKTLKKLIYPEFYDYIKLYQLIMKYFCLIGQNIKTSLSPLIHNSLFKLKLKNSRYSLYH
jgi:hypothetical protein